MSRMDQGLAPFRHVRVFPLQYIGFASYGPETMLPTIDLPAQRLDAIPVLLLGGVNLVRCLGLAGIPVIVAATQAHDPAFGSRYCHGRCVLPPLDQGDAAIEAVLSAGERLGATYGRRIPLMYGSDDYLDFIYAHRERLERHFVLLVNDPDVGQALIDKDRFQALAQRCDLPVPRTLEWEGEGPGTLAGTPRPVLAKPRAKHDWYTSQVRHRLFGDSKAMIFDSGPSALADPAVALFRDQLSFQEYVRGDDRCLWSFHGYADENGALLGCFVGRKIRTYPPLTGESAFIELGHDEELRALGIAIAARIPLRGAFKMDFKKDAATGRWHLLEVNARFTLWLYLAAHNGLNLMRIAYDYLLEGKRPAGPQPYETTYRWLSLGLDFAAFRKMRARGELGFGAWLASILLSRNVYNYFSWRDPLPWIRVWTHRARRIPERSFERLLTLVRQWRSTAS